MGLARLAIIWQKILSKIIIYFNFISRILFPVFRNGIFLLLFIIDVSNVPNNLNNFLRFNQLLRLLQIILLNFCHAQWTNWLYIIPRVYAFPMKLIMITFQSKFLEFFNIIKSDILHLIILHLLFFTPLFLMLFARTFILSVFINFKLFLKMIFIKRFLTNDAAFLLLFNSFFIFCFYCFVIFIKLFKGIIQSDKIRLQTLFELIETLRYYLTFKILNYFTEIVHYLIKMIARLQLILVSGFLAHLQFG